MRYSHCLGALLPTPSTFAALSAVTLMGDRSLVLVQEPHHKYLRGLLQPAFSKEAVYSYLPAIQALVDRHLAAWQEKGELDNITSSFHLVH